MNKQTIIIVDFAGFADNGMDLLNEVMRNVRTNGWKIKSVCLANGDTGLELHLEGKAPWLSKEKS